MTTSTTPKLAWALTLLLVSPLIVAWASVARQAAGGSAAAADPAITARISEFFATPVGSTTRRGVMFGISGGRCAFAGATLRGRLAVLPIAAIGQGLHELYPYVADVVARHPDVILVQDTSLITAEEPPTPYQMARRRLRERFLWPLIHHRGAALEGAVAGAERDDCRGDELPVSGWAAELAADAAWVGREMRPPARARVISALVDLVDSGIPTVVFAQPRNRFSTEYHDLVARRVDRLLDALGPRRNRLTVIRYRDIWPDTEFFDAVHLRPEGAANFRKRLIGDILADIDAPRSSR